ncbi:FHA domain-containing protein [bacterium]|nr:FHA domain-containing protein [bacterium]
MKSKRISTIIALASLFTAMACSLDASAETQRGIVLRGVERAGETHLKLRAFAFEEDSNGRYPITTLDKSSFQLLLNGSNSLSTNTTLTTFDSSRRWNNRAVVWVYDATGVKTMKGLTRDLRSLTAQEFPGFNADFISILGVAPGKTVERIVIDPAHQENILVAQRQLMGDPIGLKSDAIKRESALCVAAGRFEKWQNAGLKNADQKMLILMGGASQLTPFEQGKTDSCLNSLLSQNVTIQQIVFAKPETYEQRKWSKVPEVAKTGGSFRVVDIAGASRALQATRTTLDKEYLLTSELKDTNQSASTHPSARGATAIVLRGQYHGASFQSQAFVLPEIVPQKAEINQQPEVAPVITNPPRHISIQNQAGLAFDAWIEWLAIAFAIGLIVTIRHTRRLNNGVCELSENELSGDTSQGPLLVVLNGRDRGREFRIRQSSVLLGRGISCDVRLRAPHIKRQHGRLNLQGDKAVLQDLSDGELFVNGRPLRGLRALGDGAVIRLGDLQLLFRCGES